MNLTRITSIAAAAALGLAATAAGAQGGYGSLSAFDWSIDGSGSSLESQGIRAAGGLMFNETFGIEAHVASGGTDNLEFEGEDAEAELNKMLGLFAKLNLPLLNKWANVYGLAGYGYGRVDILAETTTSRITANSFAWGAGADVAIVPERLYLTVDYIDYISRSGVSASAASLGLRLSFSQ